MRKAGRKEKGPRNGLAWQVVPVVIGIFGTLAVYFLIPTVMVSSLPAEPASLARVSITNGGLFSITDIHVECRANKVVFAHTATLALNDFSPVSEFSVPRVAAGEGFVAQCPQPWSFYATEHDGFFAYGEMQPDLPPFIIDFSIDGKDVVPLHRTGPPQRRYIDTSAYSSRPLTGIDATLTLSYQLPWFLFGWHSKVESHLIGEDGGSGLVWRIAGAKEPPLADASEGFVLETRGKAVRLKSR